MLVLDEIHLPRCTLPENYGFNAIRLVVPKAGKKLAVAFKALSSNGYCYGLVGVRADNDACIYTPMAEAQKGKVSLTVTKEQPLKAVYLVVMEAPKDHSLDPSSRKFPYQIMVK